jgi:hypothetical protein
MPRKACTVCGGPSVGRSTRCRFHPLARSASQQRDYRGLAIYRQTVERVIDRDAGVCHICGEAGATSIDHYPVSYRELRRRHGDAVPVAIALDETNLRAAHLSCNRRRGAG